MPTLRWALPFLAACSDASLKVVNTPPSAEIVLPADGDSYVQGEDTIVLRAVVGDAQQSPETLSLVWLSGADGVLSEAAAGADGVAQVEVAAGDLDLGDQTVTLSVTDDGGESVTVWVEVVIVAADAPPIAQISTPGDGDVVDAGVELTLVGAGSDARDAASDLRYEWISSLDGVLDSGGLASDGEARFTTAFGEGAHDLTLRITDLDGHTAEDTVTLEVLHVNEPPALTIDAPASGERARIGDAVTFLGTAVDDEDLPEDLTVTWESDLDGPLSAGSPDSSGQHTFATDALSVGVHTITFGATDLAGAASTATRSFEVVAHNEPPGAPEVVISPEAPATTDDLVAVIAVEAVDPEGDAVSYTYQWYRDAALMAGFTADTVDAADIAKGETWMVEVTPDDGADPGTPATATVTVLNSVPAITGVTLTPTSPTVDDTLTCAPTGWSDLDGDAPGYRYAWTVDGATVSATTATFAGGFTKHQDVACGVTPDDGEDLGTTVWSSAVTVVNTVPVAPIISLSPEFPTTVDTLSVVTDVAAADADGDTLTWSYAWTKDGVSLARTSSTVGASATALEEEWTVTVTVNDGAASAVSNTARVRVWAEEGDLIITEFMPDSDVAADARGEFAELYNTTGTDISLDDHEVIDLDYDCVDLTGLVIPAGGYVVLCADDDPVVNGGITTCDHQVTWGTGSTTGCNQLALANTSDELVISNPAGVLDQVIWSTSWVSTGAATGLDPSAYDHLDNDDLSNWCDQVTGLSGGDQGTPGAGNDRCW